VDAPKQKVVAPLVAPGVEEGHKFTGECIDTREVRAFVEITVVAGQREIVNVIAPAMLLRNYMLDVVSQLAVLLAEQAILATVGRSSPDKAPRGSVHR
jgi:hypothetical protein